MVILFLLGVFIFYNTLVYYRHTRCRDSIKIRIHVNGTRGKSSVTRLIAAGLREGGIRTLAKVTGTSPSIIYPDGTEKPIFRLVEQGNIIEQVYVFQEAQKAGAEAVVIECMALRPYLQKISQDKLIKATIGVITNVRPDHLEVMGPTIRDAARALSNTIPKNSVLISGEEEFIGLLSQKAKQRNTKVVRAQDIGPVTDEMMKGFKYLEHRENVAIALSVCKYLGINPDVALRGMHKAEPDPGVLRTFKVYKDNKYVEFINALATNDPASLLRIWERMLRKISQDQIKIVLINSRKDRHSRSHQLVELICQELPTDYCILVGDNTPHFAGDLIRCGLNPSKTIHMGSTRPELVFEKVLSLTKKDSVVFAIGNIADKNGLGIGIIEYFKERSKAN